jgi:hypothetical protein
VLGLNASIHHSIIPLFRSDARVNVSNCLHVLNGLNGSRHDSYESGSDLAISSR